MNNPRRSFLSSLLGIPFALVAAPAVAANAKTPECPLGVFRWKYGTSGEAETEFVRMKQLKPGDYFYKYDAIKNENVGNFVATGLPYQDENGRWTIQASTV